MLGEFALIDKYFNRRCRHSVLGVGDDAALIAPSSGHELAISTDMLVAGIHFLPTTEPTALGWKTLAVNVSDLAAMGATPRWALLAAALPQVDEPWLAAFARGLFACADEFDIDLIGGDTTRGPLNLCLTISGEVPVGQALRRSGAQVGDEIWVSGTPGLAALGLAHTLGRVALAQPDACLAALHRPQPRLALGLALRGLAHAVIDVSDGLLADLGHILTASKVSATLRYAQFPTAALQQGAPVALAQDCLLAGGDDYELLFTAAQSARADIEKLAAQLSLSLTRIGQILGGSAGALHLLDANGEAMSNLNRGFEHFT